MDIASLVVSVVSLVIAVCGLVVSEVRTRRARTAAEQAEAAATAAREEIFSVTSLLDLSQASMQIEQVKELHRNEEWGRAIDRYTQLRQILIRAKSWLPEEKRDKIDNATRQLRSLELASLDEETNRAISKRTEIDAARFQVQDVLLEIQQDIDEVLAEIEYNQSTHPDDGRRQL